MSLLLVLLDLLVVGREVIVDEDTCSGAGNSTAAMAATAAAFAVAGPVAHTVLLLVLEVELEVTIDDAGLRS